MPNTIKIAKYISMCAVASRRKAEELVKSGRISVNGKTTNDVALRIDPAKDKIKFGGKIIKPTELAYYLLNKPTGYVSTTQDSHAGKLITELVPQKPPVWPAGRLDKETSGLIILTNDGELTQKLTHPRYNKQKEYYIAIDKTLSPQEISKIKKGLILEDGPIKPDLFEKTGPKKYRIVIHEGRKRIVRRIIEKIGRKVMELKRTRLDFLELGELKSGKWRILAKEEIIRLKQIS